MVAFGKDKLITIRLSKEEQLCILQHTYPSLPKPELSVELRQAVVKMVG